MKAISLHQPWATLCAISAKLIETRGRDCRYRGEIAIQAAKHWEYDQWKLCLEEPFRSVLERHGYITWRGQSQVVDLPLCKIVAVSNLVNTRRTSVFDEDVAEWVTRLTDQELVFGNYAPGRYGYVLEHTRQLKTPIDCRGKQAVPFDVWPESVVESVRRQLDEIQRQAAL